MHTPSQNTRVPVTHRTYPCQCAWLVTDNMCTPSQNTCVPVTHRTYPCQCAWSVTDNMYSITKHKCSCHIQNISMSVCIISYWQHVYSIKNMCTCHTHRTPHYQCVSDNRPTLSQNTQCSRHTHTHTKRQHDQRVTSGSNNTVLRHKTRILNMCSCQMQHTSL